MEPSSNDIYNFHHVNPEISVYGGNKLKVGVDRYFNNKRTDWIILLTVAGNIYKI